MTKRKIIRISENKCNGCGECIPNCPEGAIQIIDGKARLISDLFCDGLGACLGHCPLGAITIEEREAEKYDERKVMENIVKQGNNTILAHLKHLEEHNEEAYLKEAKAFLKERKIDTGLEAKDRHEVHAHTGCPGSRIRGLRTQEAEVLGASVAKQKSQLGQWPIQIRLVPAFAPFLNNANILIAADCVPFAYADFHQELLKGKILLVGCPKFDDLNLYKERLAQIFENNNIKSVTYAHMEVPCCLGLLPVIEEAIAQSAKQIPFTDVTITLDGNKKP
jgi:Pyruvate/2-oxoacid:ferredoxin oxidoreductase delta subunit